MSFIPENLKYIDSHEWLRLENDETVTVGITEYAKDLLGDVVYVELPKIGAKLDKGKNAGLVESVKAASDIYSPIAGEIVAINTTLEDTPENVGSDPYGEGWFFKLKPNNVADLETLMTAKEYEKSIGE